MCIIDVHHNSQYFGYKTVHNHNKKFVWLHRFFRRSKQDEAACPDRSCLREDRKRIEAEAESSRWQSGQPETNKERNKINIHKRITIIFYTITQ